MLIDLILSPQVAMTCQCNLYLAVQACKSLYEMSLEIVAQLVFQRVSICDATPGSFAGILIYNGLVDLLLPAFTSSRLLVGHTFLQLLAMFCVCTGYTLVAFLAKWA